MKIFLTFSNDEVFIILAVETALSYGYGEIIACRYIRKINECRACPTSLCEVHPLQKGNHLFMTFEQLFGKSVQLQRTAKLKCLCEMFLNYRSPLMVRESARSIENG